MTSEVLTLQFRFNHYVIQKNTEGISPEESVTSTPDGASCVNWVVGHIVGARNGILKTLGQAPALDDPRMTAYGRGADPITPESKVVPLPELLEALADSQQRLMTTLAELSNEDLTREVPGPITGKPEPLSHFLGSLAFHEAYHSGQLGVLRRLLGKEAAIQ